MIPCLLRFHFYLIALLYSSLCLILLTAGAVCAETPDAPIILEFSSGACISSSPEICGDGVDQDCDGVDLACPGSDADFDGFSAANDCNDRDRKVYPGIAISCTASCGTGTKTCQSNGSFSACSCSPLCEATGGGRCYYVSKLTGNDANPGTFNAPLQTIRRFSNYGNDEGTRINLSAGDVVYLMSGVYDNWIQYGQSRVGLMLIGRHGSAQSPIVIKAYPGATPVFTPSTAAVAIRVLQSSHMRLEGIEIRNSYQGGLELIEVEDIDVRNMHIHDVDGVDNDNIAGLMIHSSNRVDIHHSTIHDNYDRTNADTAGEKTGNSRNVVLFGGGNLHFDRNVVFQSPAPSAPKTGACISYKHRMDIPNATFEVSNSIFWNCFDAAIITSTYNGHFHHNLILNSDRSIDVRGHGGPDVLTNNTVEFNTIVNTPGTYYTPTGVIEDGGNFGVLTFRKNIVADSGSYNGETGIVAFEPYGLNSYYQKMTGEGLIRFSQNCYYNPQGVQFHLYGVNDNSSRSQGAIYSYSEWINQGFDTGSTLVNPELSNGQYAPGNPICQGYGYLAN